MTEEWHLAEANIARMRAPLEDPIMAGFVERLDELNQLADESPGFVWRMQSEEGDNTAIRAFDDDLILLNMSVWKSIEELHSYAYRSTHKEAFGGRKAWFEEMGTPTLVMWWIPAGHIPTFEEAKERLDTLEADGPGPAAFTFVAPFAAPTG